MSLQERPAAPITAARQASQSEPLAWVRVCQRNSFWSARVGWETELRLLIVEYFEVLTQTGRGFL